MMTVMMWTRESVAHKVNASQKTICIPLLLLNRVTAA
jgi:hypothetical protein